jgi:hypothetical protein
MFAVGCIQAQTCHTGRCPTGVATQDPNRQKALDPADKSLRVLQFHRNTLKSLAELVAAAGLSHPSQLRPHHIVQRRSAGEVRSYATIYPALQPGELLDAAAEPAIYRVYWSMARADSFRPVGL